MRNRTRAREYALQILYQVDLTRADPKTALHEFQARQTVAGEVKEFATRLVQGTLGHLDVIDRLISAHASNWEIGRMAVVDRNILRLGAYELLYTEDVPPKVCLNEAVELAKRFGDEESSKFVNGILDTIHKTRPEAATPSAQPGDPPPAS